MSTDALELALALHQAPIQRFTLRDRPLPRNIGEALQLASASQPQLETAAARFSEPEETIVEAVRFYLHQVLFEPGTDAYRILGLAPNADFKLIRQHHIWLQRWLHPDRRGEDWEAVLATKVNWAWQQLRNEASREKYDQTRSSAVQLPAVDEANAVVIKAPAWNVAPVGKPRPHWLRRVAIGSLMLVCVSLFYLAVTRQDRVDPNALASQPISSRSPIRSRVPNDVDAAPKKVTAAVPVAGLKSAPVPDDVELSKPAKDAGISPIVSPELLASIVGQQDQAEDRSGKAARDTGMNSATIDIQTQAARSDARASTAAGVVADSLRVRPSSDEIGEADGTAIEQELSSSETRKAATSPLIGQQAPKRIAAVETRSTTVASAPEKVVDSRPRSQVENVSSAETTQPDKVAPATPVLAKTADAVEVEPATAAATRTKHSEPIEAPSDVFDTAAGSTIEAPVEQEVASLPEPPSQQTAEEKSRETLARFELARQRLRGMIAYFRSQEIRPPGWGDDHGQHTVERARSSLRARNGQATTVNFALDPPTWRITDSLVSLQAAYHVDAKSDATESGQFMLNMAWQEGDWKITRIEVLPFR